MPPAAWTSPGSLTRARRTSPWLLVFNWNYYAAFAFVERDQLAAIFGAGVIRIDDERHVIENTGDAATSIVADPARGPVQIDQDIRRAAARLLLTGFRSPNGLAAP